MKQSFQTHKWVLEELRVKLRAKLKINFIKTSNFISFGNFFQVKKYIACFKFPNIVLHQGFPTFFHKAPFIELKIAMAP